MATVRNCTPGLICCQKRQAELKIRLSRRALSLTWVFQRAWVTKIRFQAHFCTRDTLIFLPSFPSWFWAINRTTRLKQNKAPSTENHKQLRIFIFFLGERSRGRIFHSNKLLNSDQCCSGKPLFCGETQIIMTAILLGPCPWIRPVKFNIQQRSRAYRNYLGYSRPSFFSRIFSQK